VPGDGAAPLPRQPAHLELVGEVAFELQCQGII
jgi:hypothetical protein